MNDVRTPTDAHAAGEATEEGGCPIGRKVSRSDATLDAFLDVADLLYERVGTALGEVGLSYAKYEVLAHLRDAPAPLSLGTLAEGQRCARSNITQIVDRLEAEGLVRRIPDPSDRRGVLAELTPAGDALVREGAARLDRVRAGFAASFSEADRALMDRLLARVQ